MRQLGSLPFFLAVGMPGDAVYAQWTALAWAIGLGLFGFADVCLLLLLALSRELARRQDAEREALAARDAVAASERRLGLYIDHLADGLMAIAVKPDGSFVFERINQSGSRMLGVREGESAGASPRDVLPCSMADVLEERWRECRYRAEPIKFERVQECDGRRRVLRVVLSPVREHGDAGDVTLILGSVRDATDSVELEAKLRQAQRMEAVGQLTAGIAHDFNNMLQTQTGALELLIEDVRDKPRALDYATMALAASERGSSLTHSLLAFSCQQYLEPQAVSLPALYDRLRPVLELSMGPRVALRLRHIPGMAAIFADRAQLETAILNLCLNARDAMAEGGSLALEAREATAAEAERAGMAAAAAVLLTVTDSGTGMAPETVGRACEPFFTTKVIGKGSGLGLSMVKGFVQQSGGAMALRSRPGLGTSIELWLPQAPSAQAGLGQARPARSAHDGRGQRILLVDDAPDLLAVTAALLEASGDEVVQAANGEEAVLLLETERAFDILVTDYLMPGINGGEVARRAGLLWPALPILVLTGYAEIEELAELHPAIEVIRKPVRMDVLTQSVAAALARAERHDRIRFGADDAAVPADLTRRISPDGRSPSTRSTADW